MVIAVISVIPMGTKTPSVSEHVIKAIKTVGQQEEVKYQLTAMGTILEGELGKVLHVVKMMHESVFSKEVQRVITNVTIDDRRDKKLTMVYKVESVTKKLE